MKKLDQYLIREMIVPFLIGTVAVVLMFQANTYIYLGKTFNLENVPAQAVVQFILYQTPSYMNMTLAVGMALGSSLAMSRIARESELTAMRAAGTRILRTLRPFLLVGVLVGIGNFYLAEKIMPPATRKAQEIGYRVGIVGMASNLKENAIVPLQNMTVMVGLVRRNSMEDMALDRVIILKQERAGELLLTMAPKGRYLNGEWSFENPKLLNWSGNDVRPIDAKRMVIHERILTDALFASAPMTEEKTVVDLQHNIALGKQHKQPTKGLEVDLHERFAVPAACIVFALVGPVFAIIFARSGGFVGVLLSIVMVLLYYNAFVISTQILSKLDPMPAWLAAWLPNILFTILGVLGIRRLE
ncbi:MAG: LptF/LptG family permease [Fimbriimonas sp.]